MRMAALSLLVLCLEPLISSAQDFSFTEVGELVPQGSGQGAKDDTIYAPQMRFPIEMPPAYANSQVYGVGGIHGPKGGQCDPINFSYPWHDNFCESRPGQVNKACPTQSGHQGQDIRVDTCRPDARIAVAAEEGRIVFIGPYWVRLLGQSGVYYSYLHMNPHTLKVKVGDHVFLGQGLGMVSDYLPTQHGTTTHLHFEIHASIVDSNGQPSFRVVSPYLSLVRAYQRLLQSATQ